MKTPYQHGLIVFRQGLLFVAALLLQPPWMSGAWAQTSTATVGRPAQSPLVSRPGRYPEPNFMLTLDTSWSMIFPYMPEGDFKLPGQSELVRFPGFTSLIMHPSDPRHDPGDGMTSSGFTSDAGRKEGDGGAIPADPGNITGAKKIFPIQMRSSSVNTLYYNPTIQYRPWLDSKDATATGDGIRYCNANATQAFTTALTELATTPGQRCAIRTSDELRGLPAAVDLTTTSAIEAYWCDDAPSASGGKPVCVKSSKPFNPGLYFVLGGSDNKLCTNPNSTDCYEQIDINKANATFKRYDKRLDCTTSSSYCTQEEERQNFANWFVYYRTRLHMAQAAIPESLLQINNDQLRLGWGTIHQGDKVVDGVNGTIVQQGVRNLDGDLKRALVDWIRDFKSDHSVSDSTPQPRLDGGTRLRQTMIGVGEYFRRTDAKGPWGSKPGENAAFTEESSCRRSYHMLITDGYYNDDGRQSTIMTSLKKVMASISQSSNKNCPVDGTGNCVPDATINAMANFDGTPGAEITTPNGSKAYSYTPFNPGPSNTTQIGTRKAYQDNYSYTLADIAMLYWKTDLNPDLDNNVSAAEADILGSGDPAFWQHLVQLPIGLGVASNLPVNDWPALLNQVDGSAFNWWAGQPVYNSQFYTSQDPRPSGALDPSSPARIDDLVHAAVNTRGHYFAANNVNDLTKSVSDALNMPLPEPGLKESGVAITKITLGEEGTIKLVPEYTTGQWTGDITAYPIDKTGLAAEQPSWSVSKQMPAPNDRNIFTWDGSQGVAFKWANIGTANQTALANNDPAPLSTDPAQPPGKSLLEYIRGDVTKEAGTSATSTGIYRTRTGRLPDFINSTPVLIQGNVNLRYDLLPDTSQTLKDAAAAYSQFIADKAKRKPVLFMGGNGGMLHAFAAADLTSPAVAAGRELFAYVPKAVIPKLGKLAQKTYGSTIPHEYFVDGPQTESDAYLNGTWKNILVGTLGAGGKGLYVLDVTDTRPAGTAANGGATGLGANSILAEISHDNLSGSTRDDMGYLLSAPQVGMLKDGTWKVFVGNGPYSDSGRAALLMVDLASGTVTSIGVGNATDTGNGLGGITLVKNTSQEVERIYAGDLKGNMWRFDVTAATPTVTKVFTAKYNNTTVQPITAAPAVVPHPKGGYMVVFGTGKLFDSGDNDNDNDNTQSLYGVWDKPMTGDAPSPLAEQTRSQALVAQVINTTPLAATATKSIADGQSYFTVTSADIDYDHQYGWYMDLTLNAGLRMVYPATAIGSFAFLNTIVPAHTNSGEVCKSAHGTGYNILLPALTGSLVTDMTLLDTNGDGAIDDNDLTNAMIYKTGADGTDTLLTSQAGSRINGSAQNTGKRPQNFKLPGIRSRIWRQIMNPPTPDTDAAPTSTTPNTGGTTQ